MIFFFLPLQARLARVFLCILLKSFVLYFLEMLCKHTNFSPRKNKIENQIRNLEIQNFKSIKHMQLACNGGDIFIGEPNTGKSNILEALSLLGVIAMPDSLSQMIRLEKTSNLFYDEITENTISVIADNIEARLSYSKFV
ncbi:Protein of unknown function [Thermoflexibacter ruber]|uniref:Endonuclease GajA/Old nuclease/RecF-like AAA domain-containing protein n=2 Tax=Thermoflexibacter ruber TaxID=1003 RepID=A0A1I2I3W2_9BACT|nr:Protein of unknown function [Thermoflexibacter ruber]